MGVAGMGPWQMELCAGWAAVCGTGSRGVGAVLRGACVASAQEVDVGSERAVLGDIAARTRPRSAACVEVSDRVVSGFLGLSF